MKILLSGASGLVGSRLFLHLMSQGHDVRRLVRPFQPRIPGDVSWDPKALTLDPACFEGAEAVIHLAGENVGDGRWTREKKSNIRDSRVGPTRTLAQTLATLKSKPSVFLCASAIGFYGNRGEDVLDEQSGPGSGFLPEVCSAWEAATSPAGDAGIRTVNLRIGLVLSPKGGALKRLLRPFSLGFGGKIGHGNQFMSWISLSDLVRVLEFALHRKELVGPVNAVSPSPVTNAMFTQVLGKVLRRPTLAAIPAWSARVAFGEMADALLLASARVKPAKLLEGGFECSQSDLESSLKEMLADVSPEDRTLYTENWLPVNRSRVFEFFSDARNLERITPPWLGFNMEHQSTPSIEEGTEFVFRLKIRGVPVRWRSRMMHWRPNQEFMDIQVSGPYAKWHHRHRFYERGEGTLVIDEMDFRVPLGLPGNLLAGPWVERDVRKIFQYRQAKIKELMAIDRAHEDSRISMS